MSSNYIISQKTSIPPTKLYYMIWSHARWSVLHLTSICFLNGGDDSMLIGTFEASLSFTWYRYITFGSLLRPLYCPSTPCLQPCIFLKMFLHHFIFIFPRCANERFSAVPDWSLPLPHRAHCEVCWDQMPSRPRHVFCVSHTIEVFCQLRGTT